ncbi:mercuric reductase [Falsiroseomonas sp. HC035]|uniref:mercuric reductase n=1 Tax=Falsiroseomonas sp. HC035 TaxID=3390999 RepID=UPI003D31992C
MTEPTLTPSAGQARQAGAAVLTAGGILAGLGAAACCALPIMFATIGVGTTSLLELTAITGPYQGVLLAAAVVSLAAAAILLWRGRWAATACAPGAACAPGGTLRRTTLAGLAAGIVLLSLSVAIA